VSGGHRGGRPGPECRAETLEPSTVSELESLLDERLGPAGSQLDAVGSLDDGLR